MGYFGLCPFKFQMDCKSSGIEWRENEYDGKMIYPCVKAISAGGQLSWEALQSERITISERYHVL